MMMMMRSFSIWLLNYTRGLLAMSSMCMSMSIQDSSLWNMLLTVTNLNNRKDLLRCKMQHWILLPLPRMDANPLESLSWIFKVLIPKQSSSNLMNKRPRKEDLSSMRTYDSRFVIWVTDVGLTIIFQLLFRHDSIGHQKLSLVQNMDHLLTCGH